MIVYELYYRLPGASENIFHTAWKGNPREAIKVTRQQARENQRFVYELRAYDCASEVDANALAYTPMLAYIWVGACIEEYHGDNCKPIKERQVNKLY